MNKLLISLLKWKLGTLKFLSFFSAVLMFVYLSFATKSFWIILGFFLLYSFDVFTKSVLTGKQCMEIAKKEMGAVSKDVNKLLDNIFAHITRS